MGRGTGGWARTLRITKNGTDATSNDSVMSGWSSASISRTSKFGCRRASSRTTSFICVHGSAQGAQKLSRETRERSWESSSWKCCGEDTVYRLESASADIVGGGAGVEDGGEECRDWQLWRKRLLSA